VVGLRQGHASLTLRPIIDAEGRPRAGSVYLIEQGLEQA
jgi:hypothetical protein